MEKSSLYISGSFISTGQLSIVLEDVMNVLEDKMVKLTLSHLAWQDVPTCAVVTQCHERKQLLSDLDLRPAPQGETHNIHHCLSQEPMTSQITRSRKNLLLLLFLLNGHILNWPLMTYCYTHKLVHLSALIRDTSFCHREQLTQRPTTDPSAKNNVECSALKGHLYHTPPSRLRDHHGRGSGKTVRGRGSWWFHTWHSSHMKSQWW